MEGHWECDGIGEIRGLRGFVLWVTMILLENMRISGFFGGKLTIK